MNRFLLCALAALTLVSCQKEPQNPDPAPSANQHPWEADFNSRYPDATVSKSEYDMCIYFTDTGGYENVAIYDGAKWLMTQKSYVLDPNGFDFGKVAPRMVIYAFLNSPLGGYATEYISLVEITRNGLDQKQYEFFCKSPTISEDRDRISRTLYRLFISEDGTLLSCEEPYGPSIDHPDMSASIARVREKYKDAVLLGAAGNDDGDCIFIREGNIVKDVKTVFQAERMVWAETSYEIPRSDALPAQVLQDIKSTEMSGKKLLSIRYVERPDANYYKLIWSGGFSLLIKDE